MRPPAPDHVAEVASGLAAVEVRPPDGYAWMGQAFDLPAEVVRLAGGDALRDALIDGIRWRLYSCFFTTGGPRPAPPPSGRPAEWRALSHELAAANCGTGCVDPGWRLIDEDDGRYVVKRRALRLWVRPDEITPTEGGTLTPGDTVAIRLPSDVPEFSPGFYMALGDQGFSADIPRALDRFYLNLRREGAVEFVRETTRRLNRAGLAFRAKVADEPQGFGRRDSALLTVERRDRARGVAAALELRSALARFIDDGTPALTRPIAPGLAFAADPEGDESFGAQRCRLLAEAAVIAHERGVRDLDTRVEVARERFADAGTSIEAPHLDAHSVPDLKGADDLSRAGAAP